MLAIVWANENNPLNRFEELYGSNAVYARALVNRAIDDWNAVILDQNFDNDNNPLTNDFQLTVSATNLVSLGVRGDTNIAVTTGGAGQTGWEVGVPNQAAIFELLMNADIR